MMERKTLKGRAREALIGQYGVVILAAILIDLVSFVLSSVFHWSGVERSLVFSVAAQLIIILLTLMLETGMLRLYLGIARGERVRIAHAFWFMSNEPDKVILILLVVLVQAVIACIPAGVLGYVLFGVMFAGSGNSPGKVLCMVLLAALAIASVLPVVLQYALALPLYTDAPHRPVSEYLEESRRLMNGWKAWYLKLLCSFLGLFLLGLCSFGIAFLWLEPYLMETKVQFYLERIRQQNKAEADETNDTQEELR